MKEKILFNSTLLNPYNPKYIYIEFNNPQKSYIFT